MHLQAYHCRKHNFEFANALHAVLQGYQPKVEDVPVQLVVPAKQNKAKDKPAPLALKKEEPVVIVEQTSEVCTLWYF